MNADTQYKKFIRLPYYTEGPVIDPEGNWYYTTLTGGLIMRKDALGKESIWARTACPNGQAILNNGHHLVCDSKLATVARFDRNGCFIENLVQTTCAGEVIHTPNDVISDRKENIYFTDSTRHEGKVCMISFSGKENILVRGLDYPNGLALSHDESTLFVAESYKNRILCFSLNEEGQVLQGPSVFANLPQNPSGMHIGYLPDGIKVDRHHHIWVAHYGMGLVHRINSNGLLVQSLEMPFPLVSNLFITNNTLIVTGGYGEPGPGGIVEIIL
jgi:gluconolactonase